MSAKIVGIARKRLRHHLVDAFPNQDSKKMAESVKRPNVHDAFFEDLHPYCDAAGVARELLSSIFAAYGVFATRITTEQLVRFLEDEVTVKEMKVDLPESMTDEQTAILAKFCRTVQSRRIQGIAVEGNLSCERASVSQLWIRVCRMSATKEKVTRLRIAALLQMAEDLNLSFPLDDFVDALFNFFGVRCEYLDFDQFSRLMETFSV